MKEFDEYEVELYYSKNFVKFDYPSGQMSISDPNRNYRANSFAFRSDEFSEGTELLIAGCSMTYGSGVSEAGRWGDVLANKLNLSHSNVARAGAAISWIVESLFRYFENYGHPKYLFCLFPDLYRYRIPVDGKHYASEIKFNRTDPNFRNVKIQNVEPQTLGYSNNFFTTLHLDTVGDIPKYIKLPLDYRKVFSIELALHENIKKIRHLESYCKAAGIELVWSTWNHDFDKLAKSFLNDKNLKFSNFFSLYDSNLNFYKKTFSNSVKEVFFKQGEDPEKTCKPRHEYLECDCYLLCHEEYRDLEPESFDSGTDTGRGIQAVHPGRHWHLHCAEAFLARTEELGIFNSDDNKK